MRIDTLCLGAVFVLPHLYMANDPVTHRPSGFSAVNMCWPRQVDTVETKVDKSIADTATLQATVDAMFAWVREHGGRAPAGAMAQQAGPPQGQVRAFQAWVVHACVRRWQNLSVRRWPLHVSWSCGVAPNLRGEERLCVRAALGLLVKRGSSPYRPHNDEETRGIMSVW
jgi:hypothetical protein